MTIPPKDSSGLTRRDVLELLAIAGAGSIFGPATAGDLVHAAAADPFGWPEANPADVMPIAVRAKTLVEQLVAGLNYLGQPADFVTRYEVEAFNTALDRLFQLAKPAEETRAKYRAARAITDDRDTHFDKQIKASAELQTQHETEIRQAEDAKEANKSVIEGLNVEVEKQRRVVLAQQQAFEDAVRRFSHNGCGLGDLLQAVSAIVGIATAVYTAGGSLVETAKTGLKSVRDAAAAAADAKNVVDFVNGVRKGYDAGVDIVDHVGPKWDDVQNAWTMYRPQLTPSNSRAKLEMDADALAAHLDDFNKQVDDAMAPPEAKAAFKKEVKTYYDLAQTRNNKLVETDDLQHRQSSLRDQIEVRKSERLQLQSLKAANQDPDAERYLRLLDNMSGALLEQIRILVWQEAQALSLWSLDAPPSAARLDGIDWADLIDAHGLISAEFTRRESLAPGSAEPFEPYTVPFDLSPDAVKGLQTDGRIALNVVRTDLPRFWYAVYVTQVKVVIPGLDRFFGTITHPGRGFFESSAAADRPHVFSMAPRSSTVTNQTAADLGAQDGKYVGLSPFTQWILAFDTPARDALKNITKIDLVFRGKNRSRAV